MLFCRYIERAASAVTVVDFKDMAIVPPQTEPAAKRRRRDDGRIRVVDHELAAEDEAIAKHLAGIAGNRRSRSEGTQQQSANEILHDTISASPD
jgi:hypothetical protein